MRLHCELRSCDADLHVLLRMWPLLQPGGVVPDSDFMKLTKNLLLGLANPDESPANHALRDLAALLDSRNAIPSLHELSIDGGMDALTIPMVWCISVAMYCIQLFGGDAFQHAISCCRIAAIPTAASLWERLVAGWRKYPEKLAMLVDDRVSEATKREVRHEMLTKPPCCVDSYMTLKLRRVFNSEALLQCTLFLAILDAWSKMVHVHSGRVEGLHSAMRKVLRAFTPQENTKLTILQFALTFFVRQAHLWWDTLRTFKSCLDRRLEEIEPQPRGDSDVLRPGRPTARTEFYRHRFWERYYMEGDKRKLSAMMGDLNADWNEVLENEKNIYRHRAQHAKEQPQQPEDDPAPPPRPSPSPERVDWSPPFGMGDAEHCVTQEQLATHWSRFAWDSTCDPQLHAEYEIDATNDPKLPVAHYEETCLERGCCILDLDDVVVRMEQLFYDAVVIWKAMAQSANMFFRIVGVLPDGDVGWDSYHLVAYANFKTRGVVILECSEVSRDDAEIVLCLLQDELQGFRFCKLLPFLDATYRVVQTTACNSMRVMILDESSHYALDRDLELLKLPTKVAQEFMIWPEPPKVAKPPKTACQCAFSSIIAGKKRSTKRDIDRGERSTKREIDQGAISAIAKRTMILNKHIEQEGQPQVEDDIEQEGPPQVEDAIDEFDASLEQQEREMEADVEGADVELKSELEVAETDDLQVCAEASLEELDTRVKELGLEEAAEEPEVPDDDEEAAEKPEVPGYDNDAAEDLFADSSDSEDAELLPADGEPESKPDDPEPELKAKLYELRLAFNKSMERAGRGETGRDR